MALANFKCVECGEIRQVFFKPGQLTKVLCDKCNKEMTREWKNLGVGTIVDENQIKINQMMLKSGMLNKDKSIY